MIMKMQNILPCSRKNAGLKQVSNLANEESVNYRYDSDSMPVKLSHYDKIGV